MTKPLWNAPPVVDAAPLSGSASCPLPARYEAVRTAREFTRTTLQRWALTPQFDDVSLVVSELVTNALRHGLPCHPAPQGEPPVRLQLMRWSSRLVCAVRDPSLAAPEATAPDCAAVGLSGSGEPTVCGTWGLEELTGLELLDPPELAGTTAESGRGLWLVDSFSDGWGWHRLTTLSGKVVWAVFRLHPAP